METDYCQVADKIDRIQHILSCSGCFTVTESILVLPCTHLLCRTCLQDQKLCRTCGVGVCDSDCRESILIRNIVRSFEKFSGVCRQYVETKEIPIELEENPVIQSVSSSSSQKRDQNAMIICGETYVDDYEIGDNNNQDPNYQVDMIPDTYACNNFDANWEDSRMIGDEEQESVNQTPITFLEAEEPNTAKTINTSRTAVMSEDRLTIATNSNSEHSVRFTTPYQASANTSNRNSEQSTMTEDDSGDDDWVERYCYTQTQIMSQYENALMSSEDSNQSESSLESDSKQKMQRMNSMESVTNDSVIGIAFLKNRDKLNADTAPAITTPSTDKVPLFSVVMSASMEKKAHEKDGNNGSSVNNKSSSESSSVDHSVVKSCDRKPFFAVQDTLTFETSMNWNNEHENENGSDNGMERENDNGQNNYVDFYAVDDEHSVDENERMNSSSNNNNYNNNSSNSIIANKSQSSVTSLTTKRPLTSTALQVNSYDALENEHETKEVIVESSNETYISDKNNNNNNSITNNTRAHSSLHGPSSIPMGTLPSSLSEEGPSSYETGQEGHSVGQDGCDSDETHLSVTDYGSCHEALEQVRGDMQLN